MAIPTGIGKILPSRLFSLDLILRNFAFLAFLAFLATIYIANRHHSDRQVRRIQILQTEINEQRNYLKSLQSENMVRRRRSILSSQAREEGLYLHRTPPHKLIIPAKKKEP